MALQEQERVLAVQAAVERYVAGRTDQDREDVVQEAMTRLLENRTRLEPDAWLSYAVVSAGNLLTDRERVGSVARRHQHRLYVPDEQPGPEDRVLTAEEHAAVQRAMAVLEQPDASLLAEHYSRAEPSSRSMAPATAARLARARAKLRVAYVLEHGRRPLPTPRCRPVLEALSTGDRRRQRQLGTARHLLACRTCATHAPALLERRRSLAGLAVLSWLALAGGGLWAAVRRHPWRSASASTAVAVAAVAGSIALSATPQDAVPRLTPAESSGAPSDTGPSTTAPDTTAPDTAAPGTAAPTDGAPTTGDPASLLLVGGVPVELGASGGVVLPAGAARGEGLPVQAVEADEGFWIGTAPGRRVWLQLVGDGESADRVRVGDLVSFRGAAVPLSPGGAVELGVTAVEGGAELEATGSHLRVDRSDLAVTSG